MFTAVVVGLVAGFAPLSEVTWLGHLGLAGMLLALIGVAVSMLAMRAQVRDDARPFGSPLAWAAALIVVMGCLFALLTLEWEAQKYFAGWLAPGLIAYFVYGKRRTFIPVLTAMRDEGVGEVFASGDG